MEHLAYEAQLAAKSEIVGNALQRIGGIAVDSPHVEASPEEFRYRNRVSFALRRLRNGGVAAGFHALHDPDRIVVVDRACLLPEQPIAEVWERLRQNWGPDAELLPSGRNLRLTLRSTATGAVALLIEGGRSNGRLEELAARTEGLNAIWHRPADADDTLHAAGAPGLPEEWGAERFSVAGSAFLQVNRRAAELLEEYVVDQSDVVPGQRVVDAYCGIGLHARRLSASGADVVGIELDPEAVRIAESLSSGGTTGPSEEIFEGSVSTASTSFDCGRVEDLIANHLPADLVILNPPRAGVADGVIASLLERPPARIIYVSCDPATLARDLNALSAEFALLSVRCFDLFPQTAHVETVVTLAWRARAG